MLNNINNTIFVIVTWCLTDIVLIYAQQPGGRPPPGGGSGPSPGGTPASAPFAAINPNGINLYYHNLHKNSWLLNMNEDTSTFFSNSKTDILSSAAIDYQWKVTTNGKFNSFKIQL
jgi:hypothetical protein